jgi:GR25 family glycosyltransferase involved in LPS biosynthesis
MYCLTILGIVFIIMIIAYILDRKSRQIRHEGFQDIQSSPPFQACFVINLSETSEGQRRWSVMQKHPILGRHVMRFPGIYGKSYDWTEEVRNGIINTEWDRGAWHGKRQEIVVMDPGEIGCILSHRNLWMKIVNESIPRTLVLEDDAIRLDPKLLDITQALVAKLPADWDILLLGFWLHRGDNGSPMHNGLSRVKDFALTHSYILSNKGAKTLLGLGSIDMPLDSWISRHSDTLHIYRHDYLRTPGSKTPSSRLIRQKPNEKQIRNTNNW